MRAAVLFIVAIAGCSVALANPAGRACDDQHPCAGGRVCTAGICAAKGGPSSSSSSSSSSGDAASPSDGGSTICGDAGVCAAGTFCNEGVCVACTYVASEIGSDDAAGTTAAPFKTLSKLADMLGPNIVGCLRAGTYAADLYVGKGGSAGKPAMVRSYPGERAKLEGRLLLAQTASFFTLAALDIDGTNSLGDSAPVVLATDVTIEDCDVTSMNKDGCIRLGDPTGGDASRAILRRNRIHDCGVTMTNSASGVKLTNGSQIQVVDNVIYGNKDHGVALYPAAEFSLVSGNVLDGNGVNILFGGTATQTSSNNTVEHNLITFPVQADNVFAFWDSMVGENNVVRGNCLFNGADGGGVTASPVGFTASDNVIADPLYVDRSNKDFALQASSPCSGILGTP